jgi:hypothetical protein
MAAHRRLAQVHALRRPAEMLLAGHGKKGTKLAQADIHANSVSVDQIKRFD